MSVEVVREMTIVNARYTVVIKLTKSTLLSALQDMRTVKKVEFPIGTVNLVSGQRKTIGVDFTSFIDVNKVAFTRFTQTSRLIIRS